MHSGSVPLRALARLPQILFQAPTLVDALAVAQAFTILRKPCTHRALTADIRSYTMPRAIVLLAVAACTSALHVQRRALVAPAIAGIANVVAPPARAGLIDFDPEAAKAAGRARAEQRRAEQKAFTDKLGTLGGVEGQVSTVGGAAAQDSREKGSGGIVPCRK